MKKRERGGWEKKEVIVGEFERVFIKKDSPRERRKEDIKNIVGFGD